MCYLVAGSRPRVSRLGPNGLKIEKETTPAFSPGDDSYQGSETAADPQNEEIRDTELVPRSSGLGGSSVLRIVLAGIDPWGASGRRVPFPWRIVLGCARRIAAAARVLALHLARRACGGRRRAASMLCLNAKLPATSAL